MPLKYRLVPAKQGAVEGVRARAIRSWLFDTEAVLDKVTKNTGVARSEAAAVMTALSEILGDEIAEGNAPTFPGLGIFYPTLKGSLVAAEQFNPQQHITGVRIRFRPALRLKRLLETIRYVPENGA